MVIRRPSPPPSGRVERVVLARLTENLRLFWFLVGTIEGTVGDDMLLRFRAVVVQVPPEIPSSSTKTSPATSFHMSLALWDIWAVKGEPDWRKREAQKRPLPQEGDDKGQVPLAHKGEWDKLLFQLHFT